MIQHPHTEIELWMLSRKGLREIADDPAIADRAVEQFRETVAKSEEYAASISRSFETMNEK